MSQEIKTIRVSLPYNLGAVNCYLIKTGDSYVLIDTGGSNQRAVLESELQSAGCQPGNLKLIVLTHGDFDHTGNAAYLRDKFGAKIAMHADDAGMAERGDMFWNRKKGNWLVGMVAPIFFGFGKSARFKPDLTIGDGCSFSEYGFDAQALSIPGHSKGSIGILTSGGDPAEHFASGQALFCGDLFCSDLLDNTDKPVLNSIMDDLAAAKVSVEKLKSLNIGTVYPGHGKPFPMESFIRNNRVAGNP